MNEYEGISLRQFVSPKRLAEEWSVSVPTVKRICERAGIPAYHLGHGQNGTVRYRREDIDKYVENCRV
ncbi:MAG: helix-turn-helix domain-containing protein [Planctomycetes bacterium]|nr:helix-turn-helix domain-containing protein [Planctomycetota bacterium]